METAAPRAIPQLRHAAHTRQRVELAIEALLKADALLVIGSSLMVYSGFRFCRLANEHGIPIAAINPGRTRADGLIDLKVTERFEMLIPFLGEHLEYRPNKSPFPPIW